MPSINSYYLVPYAPQQVAENWPRVSLGAPLLRLGTTCQPANLGDVGTSPRRHPHTRQLPLACKLASCSYSSRALN